MQAEQMLTFANKFMYALEQADIDTVKDCYHEQAAIWHNTDQQRQSVASNIKSLLWMHKKLRPLCYQIKDRTALADGFLQQHVLRGVLSDGQEYALHACVVVKVVDHKIHLIEEYIDSAQIQPLLVAADHTAALAT